MLLVTQLWMYTLKGSDNDCLADLFQRICEDAKSYPTILDDGTHVSDAGISMKALAYFIRTTCTHPFKIEASSTDGILTEILDRLIAEIFGVSRYVQTWKSRGTVEKMSLGM